MYSGFVPIDNAETPTQEMFYTLFTNSKSTNLLFWFAGGPGSSGIGEMFIETGPLKLSEPT